MHTHACLILCSFLMCLHSCNHHHSASSEQFHHRDPSCYPICYLLRLAFFSLSIILLRVIQVFMCINNSSSLLMSNILWRGCTTICLTVQSVKNIWGVSSFWLLQIKLLWIFMYRCLYEYKFSFLIIWNKCSKLELLGCMVIILKTNYLAELYVQTM